MNRRASLSQSLARSRRQLRAGRAQLRERISRVRDARDPLPEELEELVRRVRDERLTFLGRHDLRTLARVVRRIETDGVPGIVVEAGTAQGGSAIVIAAAKALARPMKVYDVFEMIPPPSDQDGSDVHDRYQRIAAGEARGMGDDVYYGYRQDLYGEVRGSFARLGVPLEESNVELVKGLFEDTINLDEPVAFAHLDGDWYESTMTCLVRIAPLLSRGGRIVIDDYYAWSGCRRAVDEYFDGRVGYELLRRAKLHVIRL